MAMTASVTDDATATNVGPMTFTDFAIYLDPLSDSTLFSIVLLLPEQVKDINFFDKTLNATRPQEKWRFTLQIIQYRVFHLRYGL